MQAISIALLITKSSASGATYLMLSLILKEKRTFSCKAIAIFSLNEEIWNFFKGIPSTSIEPELGS